MPLSEEQLNFEENWARRWLEATRSLKPELWVDPFYQDNAVLIRAQQPNLEGVAAIRSSIEQICQLFSVFETNNVSVIVDERNNRIVILGEVTMVLRPDPEQKKLTTSAAIVIKKALGVAEEKMTEEQAILDSTLLAQRLMQLGIDPSALAQQ